MAGRLCARAAVLVGVAGMVSAAGAGIITDAHFFDGLPTTLINFETTGAGVPVTLLNGDSQVMTAGAYANLGVSFSPETRWVNDNNATFEAALTIGGSQEISIPSAFVNEFTITFSVPVRAVALFVVNNATAHAVGPDMTARDAQGNVLESVGFAPTFVDGQISVGPTTAMYGIMGVYSDTPITTLTIRKQSAIFDDLRFSERVPAPAAAGVVMLGLLGTARRRR